MKYMITHCCGHEEEVALFGNTRERERRIEWLSDQPCKACAEERAKLAALEETQKRGLPDLVGSEKQVDWALSIRLSTLAMLERRIEELMPDIEDREKQVRELAETEPADSEKLGKAKKRLERWKKELSDCSRMLTAFSDIREAHWWIEHRGCTNTVQLLEAYAEREDAQREKEVLEEERSAMVVLEPEDRKTEAVATVEAWNGQVQVTSEKDEVIRLKLKSIGFSWDPDRRVWAKAITEYTGPKNDILPDTARKLLEAGVQVKVEPWVRDALESGSYEPECLRWVAAYKKDPRMVFIDKVEGVRLPHGCKTTWKGDGVISPDRWREIREFAALNGYKISQKAEAMLKAAEDATVKIKVADKTTPAGDGEDVLRAILESSRDVLEDLKDEED